MNKQIDDNIIQSQKKYYGDLIEKFTGTPMAVSSESFAHKELRYQQLSKIFMDDNKFSLHDVGMGIADFKEFLLRNFPQKEIYYSGSDVLSEYCEQSKKRFPDDNFYERDISKNIPNEKYDYVILSGVFHQKREITIPEWEDFSQNIISASFSLCNKAIGLNFISPFVDFYQAEVYYCNLPKLIFFINDKLSRFFTIEHNYALFEFTVFVYQESYMRNKYLQPEFTKYFDRH